MFGFLGYLITYAAAWMKAESAEQQVRKESKDRNIPFYFDKNGTMRHTDTNRKYTGEEIYRNYKIREENAKKEHEERMRPFRPKHISIEYHKVKEVINRWGVEYELSYKPGDMIVVIFKTEEEAKVFKEKMMNEYEKYEISPLTIPYCGIVRTISDSEIESYIKRGYVITHYKEGDLL